MDETLPQKSEEYVVRDSKSISNWMIVDWRLDNRRFREPQLSLWDLTNLGRKQWTGTMSLCRSGNHQCNN